jgi:hypothetical protein
MPKILVVFYSQTGQTLAAVRCVVEALDLDADVVDLGGEGAPLEFPFPWKLADFIETQWLCFHPPRQTTGWPQTDFRDYDGVLLGYPVWYLAPAVPMAAWLSSLPPQALAGKAVVTVATCRRMGFRGQVEMRRLVESRGGRVAAHLGLQQGSGLFRSLVTTPYYFLTGRAEFASAAMRRAWGRFGIASDAYADLHGRLAAAAGRPFGELTSLFPFSPQLAVAEIVGRRISEGIAAPWSRIRRWSRPWRIAYLTAATAMTVILIAVLLPLTLVVCSMPPLPTLLRPLRRLAVSAGPPRAG